VNYSMAYDYAFLAIVTLVLVASLAASAILAIRDSKWLRRRRNRAALRRRMKNWRK
jgi:hypothetical protein